MKVSSTSERLKEYQRLTGDKQVDILRKCEPYCRTYGVRMGRNDISQYISGRSEPKQRKLFILGNALNVSEAWLMGFDVPMERTLERYPTKVSYNDLVELCNIYCLDEGELEDVKDFIKYTVSKRK